MNKCETWRMLSKKRKYRKVQGGHRRHKKGYGGAWPPYPWKFAIAGD